MSTSIKDVFTHDTVEQAYQDALTRKERSDVAHDDRSRNASIIDTIFNPGLHNTRTTSYTMDNFLSFTAQSIHRMMEEQIRNSGLHDEVKSLLRNKINTFLDTYPVRPLISRIESKTDKSSPEERYNTLKTIARVVTDYYDEILQQTIREHTLSWKPFFKNLLTLFGLGYSIWYRVTHEEWPYGDKLALPAASQGVNDVALTLPESFYSSASTSSNSSTSPVHTPSPAGQDSTNATAHHRQGPVLRSAPPFSAPNDGLASTGCLGWLSKSGRIPRREQHSASTPASGPASRA